MKLISEKDRQYLLTIKNEDITMSLLKALFARTVKNPTPRFAPTDYFLLPENACSKNIQGYTTVGMYIFNRMITDKDFGDITGYINIPISGKSLGTVYDIISEAEFDDKIISEQFFNFIDTIEWLGGGDLCDLINVSFSTDLFTLPDSVKKARIDLFKKYEKEIAAGDVVVGAKIEEELVKLAQDELSKLPEWDNFGSGSKLSFDNGFKNMFLLKGPIKNTGTDDWVIAKSNYDEGITRSEYATFADSSVAGVFSRAKGVAVGGYTSKKFIASLQDIMTADRDSDCGTTEYLTVTIDPYFKKGLLYRYIIEGSKLVMLTNKNFDSYIGKTVKMRSPQYCHYEYPNMCNKCCGEHPYKLNLKSIGLAATKMSATLLNKSLKAFHSKKVYLYEITIEDLLWKPF